MMIDIVHAVGFVGYVIIGIVVYGLLYYFAKRFWPDIMAKEREVFILIFVISGATWPISIYVLTVLLLLYLITKMIDMMLSK